MAISMTGPISFTALRAEFGGTGPVSLSDFYRSGSLVPNTPANAAVPTSGPIMLSNLRGASAVVTPPPPSNSPPVFTFQGNLNDGEIFAGQPFATLPLSSSDAEGDPVTYAFFTPLFGWEINPMTGVISGLAPEVLEPTTYFIDLIVSDAFGSSSGVFNITVTAVAVGGGG